MTTCPSKRNRYRWQKEQANTHMKIRLNQQKFKENPWKPGEIEATIQEELRKRGLL